MPYLQVKTINELSSDDRDSELSYRRGCHQTVAWINREIKKMKSLKEIKRFLNVFEDVIHDIRYSDEGCFPLLYNAEEKIEERLKSKNARNQD